MVVAKRYVYVKPFDGVPTKNNLVIKEEKLPAIKDGEYLVETIYLSVDPYMRMVNINIGETMIGTLVGKIIESKSKKFPIGIYVSGHFGWRTHVIVHEDFKSPFSWGDPTIVPFEPTSETPLSLTLGVLGMPGNTAYFGLLEVVKPKPGHTVVVSGAAGAVGSIVGQIAKIKGCIVIGIAGSDKKNQWLRSLGFDHVINYKTQDVAKSLKEIAPQGIDGYFDNVGGEITSTVIHQMNTCGRIAVCGGISGYNDKNAKISDYSWAFLHSRLEMIGFVVYQFIDRWNEGIFQNLKWIQEGKLKYQETETKGFENMVDAFAGLFAGDNIGKAIIRV